MKIELLFAFRYLFVRCEEAFIGIIVWFAIIGTAIGVATLIIVMSVMGGYEKELTTRLIGLNGHINILAIDKPLEYDLLLPKLIHSQNIKFIAPLIEGQAMVLSKVNSLGAIVRGMRLEDLKSKPYIANGIIEGSWDALGQESIEDQEKPGIAIGSAMANTLNVDIGDTLKLIFPKVRSTIAGSIPVSKTFNISAIFDVGMHEYNANMVIIPINIMQKIMAISANSAQELEIMLVDTALTKQTISSLTHLIGSDFRVRDWEAGNKNLADVLKIERNVMFLILSLIVIVAAFNLISGLVMMVREKTKSISVLRAFGMTKASIISIFMLIGALIGIIGVTLGVIIGVLFIHNIERIKWFLESILNIRLFDPVVYFLTNIPAEMDYITTAVIALTSFCISLFASIYPAFKAASLAPAVSMRYE